MEGNNFRYLLKNKTPCNSSSKISKFQPSTFFKSKQHHREFWCLIVYAHSFTGNGKKVNSNIIIFMFESRYSLLWCWIHEMIFPPNLNACGYRKAPIYTHTIVCIHIHWFSKKKPMYVNNFPRKISLFPLPLVHVFSCTGSLSGGLQWA